tara:strand:+ start:10826 stop:10945 length:120 start_codon:yes stop_codon:yes gene_type:complete
MNKKEITFLGIVVISLIILKGYKKKWRRNRINKIKNDSQ